MATYGQAFVGLFVGFHFIGVIADCCNLLVYFSQADQVRVIGDCHLLGFHLPCIGGDAFDPFQGTLYGFFAHATVARHFECGSFDVLWGFYYGEGRK